MKVWLLQIEHRHGVNTTVHSSKLGAWEGLANYVRDWWSEAFRGKEAPATLTSDDVDAYFEEMGFDESFEITECEVLE